MRNALINYLLGVMVTCRSPKPLIAVRVCKGVLNYIKMEKLKCPKCGNEENFHINYDYTKEIPMPVIGVLCNECGEFFNEDGSMV